MFDVDDVERDEPGLPERGLSGYVYAVAAALEVSPESSWCETGRLANAYVALDRRLPDFPDHDVALLWDEESGWCVAIETGAANDPIALAWLGGDVLPEPLVVWGFVDRLVEGSLPGVLDRPCLRCRAVQDGLATRLSGY